MDEKTQRIMQRIEKIMLTPKKVSNQYRPSKSPITCRPNHLDRYLKYELASTIIKNLIYRFNQRFVSQFYNAIRTSQYRQKERIYKFIPVENSKKEQHIDPVISAKILTTALKTVMRRKYVEFINSLQNATKLSQARNPNPKVERKRSEREPQTYAVLMRTSTKPELDNYRIVNEWIDGSSNKDSKQQNAQSEKFKQLAAKSIAKTVSSNVKARQLTCFYHMQYFIKKKSQAIKEKSQLIPTKSPEQSLISPKQSLKIYKSVRSVHILTGVISKRLSAFMKIMKAKTNFNFMRSQVNFIRFHQALECIFLDHKLINFHFFFTRIRSLVELQMSEIMDDQLSSNIDSRVITNPTKVQAKRMEESQSLKVNFDSFVYKILSFIAVVSKMLIPLKEAFAKIDNYASFSYRLQQSLKTAPKRYLMDAFTKLKEYEPERQQQLGDFEIDLVKAERFNEILMPIVLERLIEGFIHIKIIERKPSLTLTLTPIKDSIIQDTIKFMRAREEHSSHSFQSWNELKSILLTPPSSEIRGQGTILI